MIMSRPQITLSLSLAILSCSIALAAQSTKPVIEAPSTATSPLASGYDVVSVKPHEEQSNSGVGGYWRTTMNGFSANVPVRSLIMSAYGLIMRDQISGLPQWAETENFDVEAKLDSENAEALQKLPHEQRIQQFNRMMQSLLADRFALRVRRKEKELPVYDLVVARGGPKLTEASSTENMGFSMGLGKINGKAVSIGSLVVNLSNPAGRIVVDKTGLTGKYEVNLTWAWNDDPSSTAPSLFTALQDQLGLKLEPAKAPVDLIVIDHIERPSEN
jgi:uncharacterized protein (TIGR03435 family)